MGGQKIKVNILSEAGPLFTGEVDCLFVPSKNGETAILPYHTPLMLLMTKGEVSIVEGHRRKITDIEKGILRVDDNQAFVLVNL